MKKNNIITFGICYLLFWGCVGYVLGGEKPILNEKIVSEKLIGQWVMVTSPIPKKPAIIKFGIGGRGAFDGQTEIEWTLSGGRVNMLILQQKQSISGLYELVGDKFTIIYDDNNRSIFIRKEKVDEYRIKQAKRNKKAIKQLLSQYFVPVDGGFYTMGCTIEQKGLCDADESPAHRVSLRSYFIGKTEVTQELWKLVMNNNPSHYKGDNLPVESFSWLEAHIFISTLNAAVGAKYRLPTEAEWEFAARGGNKSGKYRFSGSDALEKVGWFGRNSGGKTHPVGILESNELGIYDMSGNVWEWVNDWYGDYGSNEETCPIGQKFGCGRVIRGGSWNNNGGTCRTSNREMLLPQNGFSDLGFRLVSSRVEW